MSSIHAFASKRPEASPGATIRSIATTLHIDELPLWMKVDPLIRRGYRRQLGSFHACFWSLFYSHNELINIWSHLLPAFFFLWLLLAADYSALLSGTKISAADRWMIQIYVAGAAGCLFLSAFFHGINAHSDEMARHFLKLDYLGIVINISVTNLSSTYFGLHGRLYLQIFYMIVSIACAMVVIRALLQPNVDGPGSARWRAAMLTALGCSGFGPIAHMAVTGGVEGLTHFPLVHIAVMSLCYVAGTGFYVMRVPEKYWPDTFDLWGASHQIFHVLVSFGQIAFLLGLRKVISTLYQ